MRENPWEKATKNTRATMKVRVGSVEKKSRRARRYIALSSILAPILLVIILVLAVNLATKQASRPAPAATLSQDEIVGRALATRTVVNWLASTPPPLPSGEFVSWDHVERTPQLPAPDKNTSKPAYPVDVHSLTVVAASTGQLFHTQVQVVITPGGPVVDGTPSLTPYTPIIADSVGSTWPNGVTPSGVDQKTIETAVQSWADAYMSGDTNRLHQTVGDPTADHAYIPMPPAFVQAAVDDMSTIGSDSKDSASSQIIARVRLTVTWPVDNNSQARPGPPFTFDVLITGAYTGSPRVVAWGGAGTGPSLTAYMNAVTGVEYKMPDTPKNDTQKPPATPAPAGANKKR